MTVKSSLDYQTSIKRKFPLAYVIFSLLLFLIYLTSFYKYLLFHTLAELFSIVIGSVIFIICWNSRKNIDNSYFLVIGVSFLYIGFLDLIHSLAYTGMNIFQGYDTNLPTQLWIAARYLQAFSFLFASFVLKKKLHINSLIMGYTFITGLLVILIFLRIFPNCFIEGVGLTPFKIISEYIIVFLLFISLLFLYKDRFYFERRIYLLLFYSIIATIISEVAFTLYISAYGLPNLLGHVFKIITFFLLYKAIVSIGLENPVNLLFRRLKLSEEKYKLLVESAQEGIWAIDKNARTTFVNPRMAEILGYTINEMLGKHLFEFMNEEARKDAEIKIKRRMNGIKEQHDFEFLRKDGKKVYTQLETGPLFDEENQYTGAIAYVADITERKKAEAKLKQLISTVSHELRTPITVLTMSLGYLKNNKDKMQKDIEETLMDGIYRNVDLLHKLAEDLLIVSRIDEKRVDLEFIEYNPLKIIKNILTLMEPIGNDKGITFNLDIDENLRLKGDSKRIDQIFRIFIDNALKYSYKNSIIEIIALENYKGMYNENGEKGVLFQFKDKGRGISEEDLSHIFERFFRSSNASEIPGTGLGLFIAKELIELHNGKVYVNSKLGEGTTFSIFFPLLNHDEK